MQEKNHIPVFSVNQLNFYFKIPKLQDNFSCRQDFPPSSTRCGKHRVLRYWRWVKGSARYRKDTSTGDYGEMLYSLPPPPNPEVTHLSSNYSFYPPNGDMDNIFICIKNVIIFMCLWDFFPPRWHFFYAEISESSCDIREPLGGKKNRNYFQCSWQDWGD